jgi:protein-tyrosine-phosphatase
MSMTSDTRPEPFRILFLCTGNTCRSPLAEVIAQRDLAARGWAHVEIRSAGIAAAHGSPASEGALLAAARHGLDLSGHEAHQLTEETVSWADLILAMSPRHVHAARTLGGEDSAVLITDFAAAQNPDGVPEAVTDPFGGSEREYEATFELLERLVDRSLDHVGRVVAP